MELNISYTLTDWKDPMMAQLFEYVQHIEQEPDIVLALGAVADFGDQNFHYTTKVDAR